MYFKDRVEAGRKLAEFLGAIGSYYQNFFPVTDADVIRIMKEAERYGHIPFPTI